MSNIGYAVFGMPKGLAVVSNGLFKTLNLDKSLYLNNVHVVLEKDEQVLMIRRIPSNPNDLEKKDALLVALYEKALQYGENRAGGFVGSAICFKDQMPNADEMISGLTYLFSKMKENVDVDNRFTSIDSSGWNIKLPDANKKFGLEDSKLMYSPITTTNKNIVVKLGSLDKEAASLLYNFALNRTFHSVDYVYASSSKAVTDKIKSKGFLQVPFTEFFNYNKHLNYFRDRQTKDTEKLEFIKKNATDLQKKSELYTNELRTLESKFNAGKNSLNNLEKEITKAETKLSEIRNKARSINTVSQHSKTSNNNRNSSNEFEQKYNSLKRTVDSASTAIINHTHYNYNTNSKDGLNESIVEGYFKTLPKRKSKARLIRISLYAILLILLLAFLGLYLSERSNFKDFKDQTKNEEQNARDNEIALEEENKITEERLSKLKKVEKGSSTFNHEKFYELAEGLLKEHLAGKTNEKEKKYINERKWEFYEFDYTNERLVKKLAPSSQSTYFISNTDKTIKNLNPYLKWKGKEKIPELLKEYQEKEDNDIYEFIDQKVLSSDDLIVKHFEWMIEIILEKDNREISDLKIGEKIKLPFYDLKQ